MKKYLLLALVLLSFIACKNEKQKQYEAIRKSFFLFKSNFASDMTSKHIIVLIQFQENKIFISTTTGTLYANLGVDVIDFKNFGLALYEQSQKGKPLMINEYVYDKNKEYAIVEDVQLKSIYNTFGIEGVIDDFLNKKKIIFDSRFNYLVYLCWQHDIFVTTSGADDYFSRIKTTFSGNIPDKYGNSASVEQDLTYEK
ncbi:MAG: hypothetical protein ACRCX4_13955 [Bacteroidales bacterium]